MIAQRIATAAMLLIGACAWTLPDASLTPGATVTTDVATMCRTGYARSVRPPYDDDWRGFRISVFRHYGIPHERWHEYVLDHLVPLETGGAPFDARNVWPEPRDESYAKDAIEDALHAAVCYRGGYHGLHLTPQQAQAAIAHDWTRTPVGLPPPRRIEE